MAVDRPKDHAAAIAVLPIETIAVVLDALCVRAMDFVADRIDDDGASDLAADIVRELLYADMEPRGEAGIFDPDHYRATLVELRAPDPYDLGARFDRARAYVDQLDGPPRAMAESYLRSWRGMGAHVPAVAVDQRLVAILRGEE